MTRADAWWAAGLVVAATACGVLAHRLTTARTQTRSEVAQLSLLQERVSKLEAAASTPPTVRASTIPKPPSPPAREKPAKTKLSFGAARRAYHEAIVKMYTDPQYRRILHLAQKAHEREEYPDLARSLGLSPEEEERFLDLLAQQRIQDMESHGRRGGKHSWDEAQFAEDKRVRDVEHLTALGAEAYRRFQRYLETRPDRYRVRRFRLQLEAKDDLTDEATERLVEVIAKARQEEMLERKNDPNRSQGITFGTRYGVGLHIEPGEAGLKKAAVALEACDRRLAEATSAVLNATQQRHFVEYLRQSRESTLAFAAEAQGHR
jgi:hypothetical protein